MFYSGPQSCLKVDILMRINRMYSGERQETSFSLISTAHFTHHSHILYIKTHPSCKSFISHHISAFWGKKKKKKKKKRSSEPSYLQLVRVLFMKFVALIFQLSVFQEQRVSQLSCQNNLFLLLFQRSHKFTGVPVICYFLGSVVEVEVLLQGHGLGLEAPFIQSVHAHSRVHLKPPE